MSATLEYITKLSHIKAGSRTLVRTHANLSLNHSVDAFDLFTGLWWPLRQQSQFAPRRRVAWLVAKLHAVSPLPHQPGQTLPIQLAKIWHRQPDTNTKNRFQRKFDDLLCRPLDQMEPALQWALRTIGSANEPSLDWVQLTDDLSRWEQPQVREKWAEVFLGR